MDSLQIREFENAIINFVNQNTLPMEAKRLCLKDILSQVEAETNKILAEELKNREKAQKEAQKQNEKGEDK